MNAFGISEKSERLLMDEFAKYAEISEVLIFGSRAKGNFKNGSDIDLAIKGDLCSDLLAFNLSSIFNEKLPIPYHIDIVNYDTIESNELKQHINRVGKLFFKANDYVLVNEPSLKFSKETDSDNGDRSDFQEK